MADVEKYAREASTAADKIRQITAELSKILGGEFPWKMSRLMESYLSMFDRFCPYRIGDRVALVKNVNPEQGSGWYSSRHFLIQNSKGTIKGRGYHEGNFSFDVEFDDETWIDGDGNEQPVTRKHTFGFSEKWLYRCREPSATIDD